MLHILIYGLGIAIFILPWTNVGQNYSRKKKVFVSLTGIVIAVGISTLIKIAGC